MKRKLAMMLVCLMVSFTAAMAQAISGTVVSGDDGQPVIGATVKVKGSAQGTVTDVNGKFRINVKAGTPLDFSYVGMATKEVRAKDGMFVTLSNDEKILDEVMVIAYGTQKRSAFTGSAAVVNSGEIGKVQVTNAVDALKGKAAGVQIYNATGQPGSVSTIRIRGVNSILAGLDPLIVLDGSPYDGSLNDINPTDVESMTVLKDAASTALYGARGGNGVILITTKSGKRGQDAQVTVEAKWGCNTKGTADYERIDGPQAYYEMFYSGLKNYAMNKLGYGDGAAWEWANNNLISTKGGYGLGYNAYTVPEGQVLIGSNGKLNPNATLGAVYENGGQKYLLRPDNWDKEIYHNSLRQEYTVTATGATEKGSFYASANYLEHEGLVYASDYTRFSARMKADYMLKKWLKFTGNMSYSHFERNYLANEGDASTGNIFALHNIAPIYPVFVRDENGNILTHAATGNKLYDYGDGQYYPFTRPYLGQANPISDLLVDTRNNEGNTFNGTGTVDIYLPFDITFTSINNVYLHENRYTGVTNPYFGQYASSNGIVTKEHDRTWTTNYQQRLNWHHLFGAHDIEVMAGHEYYRGRDYELDYYKTNMFSQQNKELAGAVVAGSGSSELGDYNTESWLGRAMYNFDEKYFVSGSVVRQASSHFHKDNRWGTFWSASAAWNIMKEPWMNASWIDELKIKVSYGENGNDAIGNYLYTNRFGIENSNDAVSLVPSTLRGNKDITWEKNAKFNAGVDFSLFNGRLYGSIEYYNNITKDMISSFPYPASFGYTSSYANIGNMKNNGIEIDIHGDVIRTKDFTWNLYANLTTNHNEITELAKERKQTEVDGHWGYSSGNYFFTEGESRYTYYCKKYAGVDPNTGEALYYKNKYKMVKKGDTEEIAKDENGVKIVEEVITTTNASEADNYLCGDVLPDIYGGFGTSLSWKGFDLSADFQYQIGGKIFDSEYQSLMGISRGYGIHKDMYDAWTPENKGSNIPRFQYNDTYMASTSDRFLTNASFLTLSNVTFGYTLPKQILLPLGIQKVRLYVVGDNLYTWSKRKGLDPRQSITGASSGTYYSSIRSISGGISVTF